jgi:hypothetical protein
MSQLIPFEWRKDRKAKDVLLCYKCKYAIRTPMYFKCKCSINMITFFDIENNRCSKFEKYNGEKNA